MSTISIRSPKHDRESIEIPATIKQLRKPFNGTVCSKSGDEYPIQNNILDLLGDSDTEQTLAQMSNHWKLTSSMYEDLWRVKALSLMTGEDFPITEEQRLLVDWTNSSKNSLFLDAGCSTALYARGLLKNEPLMNVIALDFSSEMLLEARKRSISDSVEPILIRADATYLPFFSDTFDGIVCGGTLNEFFDPQKVLYEFKRTIKKDGAVFMMHLLKADTWYGKLIQEPIKLGGIKFWTQSESNELFEKAGFVVAKQVVRGIVCFTKLIPA